MSGLNCECLLFGSLRFRRRVVLSFMNDIMRIGSNGYLPTTGQLYATQITS